MLLVVLGVNLAVLILRVSHGGASGSSLIVVITIIIVRKEEGINLIMEKNY